MADETPLATTSQAAWALITEGVTGARIDAHRLRHLMNRGLSILEKSRCREHIYQAAGDVIEGGPKSLSHIERALDRVSYALSLLGKKQLIYSIPAADKALVDEALYAVSPMSPSYRMAVELALRFRGAYSKTPQDQSGARTWIDEDSAKGISRKPKGPPETSQDPGGSDPRERALPIEQRSEPRSIPQPALNRPEGEAVPSRTVGTPGEQAGNPIKEDYSVVTRRSIEGSDEMAEELAEHFALQVQRQTKQKGRSKQKSQQYYRKTKQKQKTKSKQRYKKEKNKPEFKKKEKHRRDKPQQHKRKTAAEELAERYLRALSLQQGR